MITSDKPNCVYVYCLPIPTWRKLTYLVRQSYKPVGMRSVTREERCWKETKCLSTCSWSSRRNSFPGRHETPPTSTTFISYLFLPPHTSRDDPSTVHGVGSVARSPSVLPSLDGRILVEPPPLLSVSTPTRTSFITRGHIGRVLLWVPKDREPDLTKRERGMDRFGVERRFGWVRTLRRVVGGTR